MYAVMYAYKRIPNGDMENFQQSMNVVICCVERTAKLIVIKIPVPVICLTAHSYSPFSRQVPVPVFIAQPADGTTRYQYPGKKKLANLYTGIDTESI